MMSITADEALEAYEAARHRLPSPVPKEGEIQHVDRLTDLADHFDVFLLDAFGVLNVGETVIPGAPESVAALQDAGKRVLVVSNAASVGRDDLLQKYRSLGYDFDPTDIVTSRQTLTANMNGTRAGTWGVVAPEASDLSDLGLAETTILGDDPEPYATCDAILLIGSAGWTKARQSLLEAALRDSKKPVLVANPDIVAPREHGFSVEPGHIAHQLADATGIEPVFYGKPFANIFDLAFQQFEGVDPSRALMVGDSLHTDILGARAYGISAALVPGFGFFVGGKVRQAIESTRIAPDFIVERP